MGSTNRPRAILIDLDGTLADSLSTMRIAYRTFLKQFDVEPTDAEFDSLNGPPLSEVVRRLKEFHSIAGDAKALLANYYDVIDRTYDQVAPSEGAVDLLRLAKTENCLVGIVTSNSARRTAKWLDTVNLSHLIDFIVSGDDVQRGKPHPEPYLLAIQKAQLPATEIIAVEDSFQGAVSAIDAGLNTYLVTKEAPANRSAPTGALLIDSLSTLSLQLWH